MTLLSWNLADDHNYMQYNNLRTYAQACEAQTKKDGIYALTPKVGTWTHEGLSQTTTGLG